MFWNKKNKQVEVKADGEGLGSFIELLVVVMGKEAVGEVFKMDELNKAMGEEKIRQGEINVPHKKPKVIFEGKQRCHCRSCNENTDHFIIVEINHFGGISRYQWCHTCEVLDFKHSWLSKMYGDGPLTAAQIPKKRRSFFSRIFQKSGAKKAQ